MKYKILKEFVDDLGSIRTVGEEFSQLLKTDFISGLEKYGFIEEIKEQDFAVIATSKLAGVEIAAEDYVEGDKKHFTWDEAIEAVKKLGNGWRLPTRKEWSLICEEFGCDEDGELSGGLLAKNLNLKANGWKDNNGSLNDSGTYGYWWSSTAHRTTYRYFLYYNTSNGLNSGSGYYRDFGFSVRCVRDVKDKEAFWDFRIYKFNGLFLELKKEGTKLKGKDGGWSSEYIDEQAGLLLRLRERGYCAEFAVGFDEAKKIIGEYLKGVK